MASIGYNEIYSRFFTKVEAYDLISNDMDDTMRMEFMCSWLHSSVYNPYVRKLFNTITLDDENEIIEFEMRYGGVDSDFIIEVLAWSMVYSWVSPKVNSITNIVQHFGESDTKFYSQSQHLTELRALRDDADRKLRSLIRDHGYLHNDYIDGVAASAKLRNAT